MATPELRSLDPDGRALSRPAAATDPADALRGHSSLLSFLASQPWPIFILEIPRGVLDPSDSTLHAIWASSAASATPLDRLDSPSVQALSSSLVKLRQQTDAHEGDQAEGVHRSSTSLPLAFFASPEGFARQGILSRLDTSENDPPSLVVLQIMPVGFVLPGPDLANPPPSASPSSELVPSPSPSLSELSSGEEQSPPEKTVDETQAEGASEAPPKPGFAISQGPYATRKLLDSTNWDDTDLGPRSTWPQSLLTAISLMESIDHETLILWGENHFIFYNDAYAEMAASKHPHIYGKPCGEAYPEIWQYMEPNAKAVLSGVAIYRLEDEFFFQTGPGGALESSFHRWMWTPIKVEGGGVGGIFSQSIETTGAVLAQRRLDVLSKLSQGTVLAQTAEDLLDLLVACLAIQSDDIPFALVYDGSLDTPSSSSLDLSLFGSVGVPSSHPSAPPAIRLDLSSSIDDGSSTSLWPIQKALETEAPVLVEDCSSLVQGFEQRSWELPSQALVIPVFDSSDPTSTRRVVFIVGLNSRRPFDEGYRSWLELLGVQVLAGLSSVLRIEAQFRRGEELAQLDRAKTSFFSNVSHELRTPLTLIQGPISDLLDVESSPQKRSLLEFASRSVQRLKRLVDMLMDVSRVEAGRMRGRFSPCHLGRFISDVAGMFRSALERGGLEYIVDCDMEDERLVYIDEDLMEKICFNILNNAYKYCLSGSVTVRVVYEHDRVVFSVADTGVGIPKADIDKVVDRFHRVSSLGRSTEGTGIGLSFASDLVKLHGGTLSIVSQTAEESTDGSHGSTFQVAIPFGSLHLPPDQIEEKPSTASAAMSRGPSHGQRPTLHFSPGLTLISSTEGLGDPASSHWATHFESIDNGFSVASPMSPTSETPVDAVQDVFWWSQRDLVLVVDDNADMRRYLVSILTPHVRVIEAADGLEALELAQLHLPDLILSDVMMSRLDGNELLARLRSSEGELSMIPVILITAKSGENEKVSGLMTGAEDYLVKPFSSKELIARAHLHLLIGKRRIDLERKFAARTEELKARAVEAEARRQEADQRRQQQELLVDVTNHEGRTYLSVLHNSTVLCRDNLTELRAELERVDALGQNWSPSSKFRDSISQDIEALESVLSMTAVQERISQDLQELAQIQRATLALQAVHFDVVKETRRVISSIRSAESGSDGTELALVLGETLAGFGDKPVVVYADAVRFSQILFNLLTHALTGTRTSVLRRISIHLDIGRQPPEGDNCLSPTTQQAFPSYEQLISSEPYIFVEILDTGLSLSETSLQTLFDSSGPAQETQRTVGGSGLGIFVAKKLCELMDGKIEVVQTNVKSDGSSLRFYVRTARRESFPLVDISAAQLAIASAAGPGKTSRPSSPQHPRPCHVLVVEDNVIGQKVLQRQLHKAGLTCDLASDGLEALDLITTREYAVVLSDLEMPRCSGIEFITRVRAMEASGELSKTHVVFAITGNARQGQIDRALEAGMNDIILKPYRIGDVLAKLRTITA